MSAIQLLRNARLWVSTAEEGSALTAQNTKEILIQDDFSFSQNTSSSDISLDEAGPVPARGSTRFNDSLDPVEWSFSTYLRTFQTDDLNDDDTTGDLAVISTDAILWHCLASTKAMDLTTEASGVYANLKNLVVTFEQNQGHNLAACTLYIKAGSIWYKITNSQVGQAEISFDISAIAMTSWSGSGAELKQVAQPFDPDSADFKFSDVTHAQATYIKNKLTVIKCVDNADGQEYQIPITGGSLTINNNITNLTPSTLSKLDISIGSFTGTFDVSGSVTAYLRSATGGDTDKYTAELLAKMQVDRKTQNSFSFAICLGGIPSKAVVDNTNANPTRKNPVAVLLAPNCHLSTPTVESGDVFSTTIEFKAIPSDFSVSDSLYIGLTNDANAASIGNFIRNQDMADTAP